MIRVYMIMLKTACCRVAVQDVYTTTYKNEQTSDTWECLHAGNIGTQYRNEK